MIWSPSRHVTASDLEVGPKSTWGTGIRAFPRITRKEPRDGKSSKAKDTAVSQSDSCTSMLVLAGVDKTCQRLLVAILVEAYGRR